MTAQTRAEPLKLTRESDGVAIDLRPLQGTWTEEQYLKLTDHTRHLVEFTDGLIEVLPMPTDKHQMILRFVFLALMAFVEPRGGRVLFAALRLRIRDDKFREPDILLVRDAEDPRRQNRFWLGADLVVEVVSEDDPERDTVEKVGDYAEAGIPEYWIVNPQDETISVLALEDNQYVEHGLFRRGQTATSALLDGFTVSVDATFDAK
jgi:Uma2 family endonuclease